MLRYPVLKDSQQTGGEVMGVCPGTLHPRMCIQITREPCYNAHSDSVGLSQDLDFYTNKLPGDTLDSDGPGPYWVTRKITGVDADDQAQLNF